MNSPQQRKKAAELSAQIQLLPNSHALTETQRSFLVQTDDLRLVQHAISLFARDGKPEPDDLQERALRLELQDKPHELELARALITLLLRSGRPPLPDLSRVQPSDTSDDDPELENLLRMGAEYARAGETFHLYAALWQACVRYPQSVRGWAEFARALADRREWDSCKIAAQHVLDAGASNERPVIAMLSALDTLAANGKIGSLGWDGWAESLPPPLNSHPLIAQIHLATNNLAKAVTILPRTMKAWPDDAETAMAAALVACERNEPQQAYDHIRRAFELNPRAALRAIVGDFGERFGDILDRVDKFDEIADYLSSLSEHHEDMNLVPHWPTPEAKLAVQRKRRTALERGLPSVFLVTQSKSASTSVGRIFSSGFELPTILYSLLAARVISPWLQDYLRGGACYVTHLESTAKNIDRLVAGGAKRIIVHTRDPRQWVISLAEHARLYANLVPPSVRDRRAAGFADGLNFTIEMLLPRMIGWIKGWLKARERLEVRFTTFEEFVRDPDEFLDRMLSFYGGDIRYFDRQKAFKEQPGIDYRRRAGLTEEWKAVLMPEQVRQINDLIPNECWNLFGWQP